MLSSSILEIALSIFSFSISLEYFWVWNNYSDFRGTILPQFSLCCSTTVRRILCTGFAPYKICIYRLSLEHWIAFFIAHISYWARSHRSAETSSFPSMCEGYKEVVNHKFCILLNIRLTFTSVIFTLTQLYSFYKKFPCWVIYLFVGWLVWVLFVCLYVCGSNRMLFWNVWLDICVKVGLIIRESWIQDGCIITYLTIYSRYSLRIKRRDIE